MEIQFTAAEIRALGCLIEKESTTPEAYPLTLNSLTRACNQKSNREPVMELSEAAVQEALDNLAKQMLVSSRSGSESRVIKYSHRMKDRRTPEFDFNQAELAVVSVLLVRGPQTLGEIRTRSARIHQFDDMQALMATLTKLGERVDGPYVKQLPRHPGQKESRYTHLFAGDVEESFIADFSPQRSRSTNESDESMGLLEQRVSQLEEEITTLREELHSFIKQFE
ncbi:MAG: hypothetical protein ACI9MF_001399 [Gammaproteobacteria bacterium]